MSGGPTTPQGVAALLEEVKNDEAAWATVDSAYRELKAATQERERLDRMRTVAFNTELELAYKLRLALTVIKNRQEGKAV